MEPNLHKIKTGRWNSQHLSTIIKTKPKVFYVSTIASNGNGQGWNNVNGLMIVTD